MLLSQDIITRPGQFFSLQFLCHHLLRGCIFFSFTCLFHSFTQYCTNLLILLLFWFHFLTLIINWLNQLFVLGVLYLQLIILYLYSWFTVLIILMVSNVFSQYHVLLQFYHQKHSYLGFGNQLEYCCLGFMLYPNTNNQLINIVGGRTFITLNHSFAKKTQHSELLSATTYFSKHSYFIRSYFSLKQPNTSKIHCIINCF